MLRRTIILGLFVVLMSGSAWAQQSKPVIYQMLVRLFGNTNLTDRYYGSIQENGCGKFDEITDRALDSLKALGVTAIWYTGVLEHATMTDYSRYGIEADDPDVVKGRAGSPYAVKDYYDVDPDLAVNVNNRMGEFRALVRRTHAHGLGVYMDFVPNHLARGYHSDAAPDSVISFGQADDTTLAFSPKNDFYYIPGSSFEVPEGVDAGGPDFHSPLKDGRFHEAPAKATGNNVFRPNPSINDWYETVKLNYGVDVQGGGKSYFNPIPPVWVKMRDILDFWAAQGVDGFRCDVAEMVPAAFWHWVIPQVKAVHPGLVFIGEAYDPRKYSQYLSYGHFDYLYNKVGLYDVLAALIKDDSDASTREIDSVMTAQSTFADHMLDFLENHDEERVASHLFAGDAIYARPAMVVAATISRGPVLIYFGQELGERAEGKEGFGGDDGKTTIFDYWGVPTIARWNDGGRFDQVELNDKERRIRSFYRNLLGICREHAAITAGRYMMVSSRGLTRRQFAYLRFGSGETILVVVNFDRKDVLQTRIALPRGIAMGKGVAKDLLSGKSFAVLHNAVKITVGPSNAVVLKLQ